MEGASELPAAHPDDNSERNPAQIMHASKGNPPNPHRPTTSPRAHTHLRERLVHVLVHLHDRRHVAAPARQFYSSAAHVSDDCDAAAGVRHARHAPRHARHAPPAAEARPTCSSSWGPRRSSPRSARGTNCSPPSPAAAATVRQRRQRGEAATIARAQACPCCSGSTLQQAAACHRRSRAEGHAGAGPHHRTPRPRTSWCARETSVSPLVWLNCSLMSWPKV